MDSDAVAGRGRSAELAFGALLAPILAATAAAVAGGPLAERLPLALPLLAGGGLAWLAALSLAPRVRAGRGLVLWIVAGGVLLRVAVLLAGDPAASDDRFRYAFEGGLVLAGKSPYAAAPDAPERAAERAAWPATYAGVNHPSISAAYPPLAQGAFALIVGAAGGVERAGPALRVAFALSDLAVLAPLASLLRRRGRSLAWLAAWAWCPLAAFEFAGGAHLDSLAILLLVSAADAAERGAGAPRARAALLLALGALVKLLPAILLPFVLRGAARPGRALLAAAAPCALALAGVAALQGGLSGLGRGVSEYALRWESASAVHRFVEAACARAFDRDGGPTDPRRLARAMELLAWLAVGAAAWRRGAGPAAAAFALLGAFLVLTPTLHPWYVAWIVPWLALFPARSFAFLAAAAPLLYAPLGRFVERGEWVEPSWLWPCVLLPFLALLAFELARPREARA